MNIEQINSKTINKINLYIENKQKLALKLNEKRNEVNDLQVEYELEEQAYLTDLNEGALSRMKEIKQDIAGLEIEIRGIEVILNENSKAKFILLDDDRQELSKSFSKACEKRDKLFNDFLKKKGEVIAAYNKLKEEHEDVNDLYLDIIILVENNLERAEYRQTKAALSHIQNGDIIQEVKDMFEQCSTIKSNPDWSL
ncbi:hypothetical protein [Bacillus sp. RS11]|uniref:hypothetical protein n=1 Tax=Lysinibacillus sp. RS11 TaxID=3242682 RepID=UPI0035C6E971